MGVDLVPRGARDKTGPVPCLFVPEQQGQVNGVRGAEEVAGRCPREHVAVRFSSPPGMPPGELAGGPAVNGLGHGTADCVNDGGS